MGEVINFPERDSKHTLTAHGRFLLAVDEQQEAEAAEAQLQKMQQQRKKPTLAESRLAKKELDFIFSGSNQKDAERMYWRGLNDIVYQRSGTTTEEKIRAFDAFTESMGLQLYGMVIADTEQYTPEAQFYIYVERLTEIANHAYDHSPGKD